MLNFENKPIEDWTLAEAKEYCKNKKCDKCYGEEDISSYCKLDKYKICCNEPFDYDILICPQFTSDEIASLRLIKKTYPWVNYIVRSSNVLLYTEYRPCLNDPISIESNSMGKLLVTAYELFPQIKCLTYYAVDDIIKQGDNNNA